MTARPTPAPDWSPEEDLDEVLADIRVTGQRILDAADVVAAARTADERIVAIGVLHHHVSTVRADKLPGRVFALMAVEKRRAMATYRDIIRDVAARGGSLGESRLRQCVAALNGGPARPADGGGS